MSSAFGATPTSTTVLVTNQFPVSAAFEPGTANGDLTAVQAGPGSVDGNGRRSAPVAMYVADGNVVALGTTTDASSANTLIGLAKAIKANTASVTIGSLPSISGTVTANQGGTWNLNNISGTISLPTGAATAAKQPAIGAAGSASTDVLTVQGIASMTPLKVDGSGVTQPVSGTFWQATQPVSGTVSITANSSVNVAQLAGTTTDTNSGNKSAGTLRVVLATDQPALTNALKVDGSAVTQPVSGTVTANIGTTNGLALDATVAKLNVAQAAALGSNTGPLMQGSVTTNAPTYVTGNINPLSLDTAGLLRASLKDTPSNTNNLNVNLAASAATVAVSGTFWQATQPVSGTVTANQGGSWSVTATTNADTTIGGTSAPSKGLLVIGKTNDGTPQYQPLPQGAGGRSVIVEGIGGGTAVPVSGTFWQATQPVSGTVTANAGTNLNTSLLALESGGNLATLAGGVTSSKYQANIAQIGGSSVSTAATGVQKVGIVGNGGATLDSTVGAGTAPTNALAVGAIYNTSAPAPTNGQAMALQAEQAGNLRTFPGIALAALSAWSSGTSLNAVQNIFTNSGAPAVLVQLTQTTTITGGAITFEVSYDGSTWVTATASQITDPTSATYAQISLPYTLQASTNKYFLISSNGWQGLRIKLSTQISGTGTVTPNYALLFDSPLESTIAYSPTAANFLVTVGAALPAGGNTIGAVTQASGPWTSNITQFGSSNVVTGTGASGSGIPRVTVSNDSAVLATPQAGTSGGSTPSHTISANSTNATNTKNSAGMVYGLSISNTNASARFFKLYNKASAPTVGTDTPVLTLQIPGSATVIRAYPIGLALGTGIAWAATTGIADSDTGAVGASDLSIDIDWK